MLEKKTIIDQIEITRDGTIQIRMGLLVLDDGVELSCHWHRTAVEPGGTIDTQLNAVDAHLQSGIRGTVFPIVDKTKVPLIKSVMDLVHTPEVVTAHRQKVQKAKNPL